MVDPVEHQMIQANIFVNTKLRMPFPKSFNPIVYVPFEIRELRTVITLH